MENLRGGRTRSLFVADLSRLCTQSVRKVRQIKQLSLKLTMDDEAFVDHDRRCDDNKS